MTNKVSPLSRIFKLLRAEGKEISSVYFFAIMNGLILLAIPVGIQALVGFALTNQVSASIIILIILIVLSVLASGIMQVKQMQIIEKIQQKIYVRYSFEISKRIPAMKLSAVDNYYLPELTNRFFDVVTLQKSLAKLMLDFPLAIIQILFGLILLAFYHPVFIAFGLVLSMTIIGILYFSGTKGLEKSIEESNYKYKTAAWLQEMARAIWSVKFIRSSYFLLHKTDEHVTAYLNARTEHFRILQIQFKALVVFKTIITSAMLIVGTLLLLNQQLNVGQFIAAEIVILTIISSVEKLIVRLDNVYDVLTSVEKLEQVIEKETETDGNIELPEVTTGLSIKVQNLSFNYPTTSATILQGISFEVEPGEKICISGPEGSGKSTLLRLLAGCYDEFSGSILLNDVPLNNYNRFSLRKKMGVVLNGQDIIEASLFDNLTLGQEGVSLEEVRSLCNITGLTSYIQTLKQGFDTQLSSTGRKLPEHAAKKIVLVRALLNQPRLLLLEEPWAGLEKVYQDRIKEYLLTQEKQVSMIVVTSDESFINKCDKSVLISKTGTASVQKNK
ncbi:MAG: ATP-binding cassette domain-containing protein [Ferruginibacter sp.]